MSCSVVLLAAAYHKSIKRVVRMPRRNIVGPDGVEDILSPKVDLWSLAKVKDGEIAAEGLRGGLYVFNEKKLRGVAARIINTVKTMPVEMRRSVSTEGIPWIFCRRAERLREVADDVMVERILIMAMALGYVTNLGEKGEVAPIPYVMVDDIGLCRKEKVKDVRYRVNALLHW